MAKGKNNVENLDKLNNKETNVVLEMPEEVVIKLVQENLVKDYELLIWLFNASITIAASLWTAFYTLNVGIRSSPFFSSVAFSIFSIVLIYLIWKNRKKVFSISTRKILKISDFNKN
ncbi:MAG: hypothetical protein NT155_00830 [Candidatus Staskawiczbacteria bacterium]|nr:hypothetical protein [Candidatus Staskawiczbacteria bacterium]